MTRNYGLFSTHSVGLDRLFNELHKREVETVNYPPYNILQLDSYQYLIELAVAGFNRSELELEYADDLLKITGNKALNEDSKGYLHKGIGLRSFTRTFVLSPDVKIGEVALEDGLLKIQLEREIPEHKKPRKIEISNNLSIAHEVPDDKLLLEKETEKAA